MPIQLAQHGTASRFHLFGPRILRLPSALVLIHLAAGCSAPAPEGGNASDNPTGIEPNSSIDANGNACTPTTGAGVLRRLTPSEYETSLSSVFSGANFPRREPLPGNLDSNAFSTGEKNLLVVETTAETVAAHAEEIAAWVDPTTVAPCQDHSAACWESTILDLGRKFFRAPVPAASVPRYVSLFEAEASFGDGLKQVVSAMIQSPYFLYRRELGMGENVAELSSHELASALAYSLTGAPPDTELSALADSGQIADSDEWASQVDRLLGTPAAEAKFMAFVNELFHLDEIESKTKTEDNFELNDSLRASLYGEAETFVQTLFRGDQGVSSLLNSSTTHVNAELASYYGLSGPAGESHEEVSLADTNRVGGVLGLGAFLTVHSTPESSSPVRRGLMVVERLLCGTIPPPPPTTDTSIPQDETATTRQRFEQHLETGTACNECHQNIDPLGFGFENYDGLGRYRDQENGVAVDSSGETVGFDETVAFTGLAELTSFLAENKQVRSCFAQQYVEYTVGQPSWDDQCSVNHVDTSAAESGGSFKNYLQAILQMPHTTTRQPQAVAQ